MAVAVVDLFEIVEIEEHEQRRGTRIRRMGGDDGRRALREGAAIVEPGEEIRLRGAEQQVAAFLAGQGKKRHRRRHGKEHAFEHGEQGDAVENALLVQRIGEGMTTTRAR